MKSENYLVTATELNEMAVTFGYVTKNIINDSIKTVTKTEANTAFFLDQATDPYATYTGNRCPRYQDFKCPDPGVNLTLNVIPYSDNGGCTILPSEYVFQLSAGSGPSSPTSTIVFDVTLPAGLTYGVFKYIYYNGQALNPTAPYYVVTNQDPQYFRVILNKQIGNNDDYTIAFTVNRNELYGTRQVATNLTSTFCTTTTTTPKTFTYTDTAPQISAVLSAPNELVDCGPVIEYRLDLTNSGAPVCGSIFEFTAPTDIHIDSSISNYNYDFEHWWCFWCDQYTECESCGDLAPDTIGGQYPATGWWSEVRVYYNDILVDPDNPANHTEWYDVLEFNETTGKVKVRFNKSLGDGNSYKLYFYAHWTMPSGVTTTTINSVGTMTYKVTSSNATTTISTNTVTSTLTRIYPVTYYELIGCAASDYAYTLLQPLGVNNRYVHSQTAAVYLATGNTVSQCTVPNLLNESIQRTTLYNCSDAPPPPPPPPPIENINFTIGYTCTANNQNNITISNITGGTGSYEVNITPHISQYNASTGSFTSLGGSSYTYYDNQNGTWYVAVRDTNEHTRMTIKGTDNIYCCPNTSPSWQNNGTYNCYGTCNQYHVEQDYNSCSGTSGQTRQGQLYASNSISCGGCCGQGPCCGQSTAQTSTIDPIGIHYSCSGGNVNSTNVYGNSNSCYTGPDIYLFNGAWQSANPINSYPSTAAVCQDSGSPYCSGSNWVINRVQTNDCSSASCDVRVIEYNSVTHGCYDPCTGNNYDVYTDQQYTTCYNCTNAQVYKNTNLCSSNYGKYYVNYNGYVYVGTSAPSGLACNTNSNCQDTGNAYCSGPNWVINQYQANGCSNTSCGTRVIEYDSVANGCYTPPSCTSYRMENYNGYGLTDYVEWTDCNNYMNSTYVSDGSWVDICSKNGTSLTYSYSTPVSMGTC